MAKGDHALLDQKMFHKRAKRYPISGMLKIGTVHAHFLAKIAGNENYGSSSLIYRGVFTMADLTWIDWLIFVGFLLISLAIGMYHAMTGGKQRTTEELIMPDRKLRVIPTMMPLLASNFSAVIIVGNTAEMYTRGIQAWPLGMMGFCLGALGASVVCVPWLYPMKLTSTNEVGKVQV